MSMGVRVLAGVILAMGCVSAAAAGVLPVPGACTDGATERAVPVTAVGLNAATPGADPGETFWHAIRDSAEPALFAAYLARSRRGQFAGRYTDAAKERLKALRGGTSDGAAGVAAAEDFTTRRVTRTVTVRAQPSFGTESLGKLVQGDTVTAEITAVDGPWRKIRLKSGKVGYVLSDPFGGNGGNGGNGGKRRFE